MAQRRMFSKDIVRSDAFLDMPVSSQLLYFQLGMEADDDGFLGNSKSVIRLAGANDDDMKILLTKRFILLFESGIMVIKHWKVNNLIRKDRYRPTQYLEEKNRIQTKENNVYTEWQPMVNQRSTEVRLGEGRGGKATNVEVDFSEKEQLVWHTIHTILLKDCHLTRFTDEHVALTAIRGFVAFAMEHGEEAFRLHWKKFKVRQADRLEHFTKLDSLYNHFQSIK